MKIVVFIKQVPGTTDVTIDPETKRLVREGVEAVLNPFDLYAVEEGVQIREKHGGEVIVVTMGPPQAEKALREALGCGADTAILLSDRAFAGSDTWATSYALACAVRTLGHVDLIICGKQAVDGDTAQVGPGIAAHLEWPQATYVSDCTVSPDAKTVQLTRMHEDGYDILDLDLPCVLTVVKDINHPRVPSLLSCLASRDCDIPVWTSDDITANHSRLGLKGSPTRVVATNPPPPRDGETVVFAGPAEESAVHIVQALRQRSLL